MLPAAEAVGLIYGKTPGSKWEWYEAVALWYLGWTFSYQVSFFGGRRTPGGQIIDFLVDTVPLRTPVYCYGDYWHGGPKKDADTFARLVLAAEMGNTLNKPVVFEGKHLQTLETAIEANQRVFGRGPGSSLIYRYVAPF